MKTSERVPCRAGIGLELRRVDDRELRPVRRALRRIVLRQKHVAREQIVPGELVDDANRQTIRGSVPAHASRT